MKRLMYSGLVAISALTAGLAQAGNTYWTDNTGADWSTANWSAGTPGSGDKAWIGHTTSGTNPASVTISADVTANELDVAYQNAINVTGTVTQTGGTATFGSGGVKLAGANGDGGKYPTARYFLNGGTFTNSGDLYIGGNQVYSDAAFVQTAGTATVNTVNMYAVTGSGRGASLVVSGGVFICRNTLWVGGQGVSSLYGGNLIIANNPSVQAKYVYCNANMTVPGSSSNFSVTTEFDLPYWASVPNEITCTFYGVNTNVPWSLLTVAGTGHKAQGTFVIDGSQGGGLFQVKNINLARSAAGATGTVKVVNGGKLRAGVNSGGYSYAWCGDTSGTALIRLGDASSLGWIEWLPGNAVEFYLRNDASGSAELRGVGGFVTNSTKRLNFYANGRIVADGWGAASERDLDLSFTANLRNNIANGASESNGWYAVNRARLIMPPVTVATGSNNYNLGDEGSADNDLVNSVRCSFTGVTTGGAITNTLLALDRGDVPVTSRIKQTVSAHQVFSPAAMAFGGLTLTFRYDANACQAQGLTAPDVVQVYGGTAVKLPVTALDTTNKRVSVTVSALHGTDTFLLGKAVSSGTVITIF